MSRQLEFFWQIFFNGSEKLAEPGGEELQKKNKSEGEQKRKKKEKFHLEEIGEKERMRERRELQRKDVSV